MVESVIGCWQSVRFLGIVDEVRRLQDAVDRGEITSDQECGQDHVSLFARRASSE